MTVQRFVHLYQDIVRGARADLTFAKAVLAFIAGLVVIMLIALAATAVKSSIPTDPSNCTIERDEIWVNEALRTTIEILYVNKCSLHEIIGEHFCCIIDGDKMVAEYRCYDEEFIHHKRAFIALLILTVACALTLLMCMVFIAVRWTCWNALVM